MKEGRVVCGEEEEEGEEEITLHLQIYFCEFSEVQRN
jgi:hypothetical protein